jgi:hypothetical protein
MAQQEILGHQCVAVAHGRAEKAEQEQQVLEHRPTSCRSRPADVPSDFCTPTAEDDGLVILGTTASTAARAGRTGSQEGRDLARKHLALQFQQQRLGLS